MKILIKHHTREAEIQTNIDKAMLQPRKIYVLEV